MRHANNLKFYLALIAAKKFLNFTFSATHHFWILERLAFSQSGGPASSFRKVPLRASPSSQSSSLPNFNFGAALPTRCTNYSVLQKFNFLLYICTLDFKIHFKGVVILRPGMETLYMCAQILKFSIFNFFFLKTQISVCANCRYNFTLCARWFNF